MFCGQYYKTGIPVGSKVPITAATHQSDSAIVASGTAVVSAYNDWRSEKLVPSITHKFNIIEKSGGSIFSGGPSGKGYITLAIPNYTLQPSTGLHNAKCVYQFMRYDSREGVVN